MSEWITKFRRRGQSVQKFHSSETINCFALANTANTLVKMINKLTTIDDLQPNMHSNVQQL